MNGFFFHWMSNSLKVPNLVCDPRENLRKLASTSKGKNYQELARRPLHHFSTCGVLFFILCEPHEKICCMNFAHGVWNPQMKTNHVCTKMYFNFRKFIYRWLEYPQGSNCYQTSKVVKRKGCRIEKWTCCCLACYDNDFCTGMYFKFFCLHASQYVTAGKALLTLLTALCTNACAPSSRRSLTCLKRLFTDWKRLFTELRLGKKLFTAWGHFCRIVYVWSHKPTFNQSMNKNISYECLRTPRVQFANIRKMVLCQGLPHCLRLCIDPCMARHAQSLNSKSTCLTAKFGSFLDHVETGENGQMWSVRLSNIRFLWFLQSMFLFHTFTIVQFLYRGIPRSREVYGL